MSRHDTQTECPQEAGRKSRTSHLKVYLINILSPYFNPMFFFYVISIKYKQNHKEGGTTMLYFIKWKSIAV